MRARLPTQSVGSSFATATPTPASSAYTHRLLFLPTLAALLFLLSVQIGGANAAFTTAVNRNRDYVEPNADGQMCFYPKAADASTLDVACVGASKGDYAAVMAVHLNLTTSINYFSGSLERLGGPEWVVQAEGRRIYLCLTGRAGDFTYQTACTTVGKDNSLGNPDSSPMCKVAVGQSRVTDGCYVPNQDPPPLTVAPSSRSAVVTVTRTSTPATSTVTRTQASAAGTAANSTADDNAGRGLSGYLALETLNIAILFSIFTAFFSL